MQRFLVVMVVGLFALAIAMEEASARGPRGGGGGRGAGRAGKNGGGKGGKNGGGKVGQGGKNGGKVGQGGKNGGKVGQGGKNGGKPGANGGNGGAGKGKQPGVGKNGNHWHHHHPGRVWRRYHRVVGGGGYSVFGGGSGGDVAPGVDGAVANPALYGVLITNMYPGTAARRGLRPGDVIMSFDGAPTPTFQDLYNAVQGAGSEAEVVYINQDTGVEQSIILNPENRAIGVAGESVQVE